MVSVLEINKQNTVLFSGDSFGFIYLWNVDGYAVDCIERDSPEGMETGDITLVLFHS